MLFAPLEKENDLGRRLFEAVYERGENASDVSTLLQCARDCGVDADGFKAHLDTPKARDDVRRECAQASARGVRGVPYFVVHGAETKRLGSRRGILFVRGGRVDAAEGLPFAGPSASPAPSTRRSWWRSSGRCSE